MKNQHLLSQDETATLIDNVAALCADLTQSVQDAEAALRSGAPNPVTRILTGNRGRPKYAIDHEWLIWAVQHRSVTHIAKFLNVSVPVVQKAMIECGIRPPMSQPIIQSESQSNPGEIIYTQITSYTVPVSQWNDDELDHEIMLLHAHFPNAGVTMLHGHFRQRGENVPHECIRQALHHISPSRPLFHRPPIRRRQYQVPGPNYLWHHDGQHGG